MKVDLEIQDLIPGGAHTYSRGWDQFSSNTPRVLVSGKGCGVTAMDGREFIDFGMGLRSTIVGYAETEIDERVIKAIQSGNNLTLPTKLELEAAQSVLSCFSDGKMVKFAKTGSAAVSAAVKLARACTGRSKIAVCRDQPFFSYDDWFIGSTVMNKGVPEEVADLTVKFDYGCLDSVADLVDEYGAELACFVLEPVNSSEVDVAFLKGLEQVCKAAGIILILDEMISGFRVGLGGAQEKYGLNPDLSTFGKALGNGYSVACVVGSADIMELGGIRATQVERTFLLSSTHGSEATGMAAAIATIDFLRNHRVHDHIRMIGETLIDQANSITSHAGLGERIFFTGLPYSPVLLFKDEKGSNCAVLRTLFQEHMVSRGILAPYFAICYRHDLNVLDRFFECLKGFCDLVASSDSAKDLSQLISGHLIKPVFRRYN